jgi:hypothetical protein
MADERPDDRLDVPIEPVGASGRDRRRAFVAFAAVVSAFGFAIALAVLTSPPNPAPHIAIATSPVGPNGTPGSANPPTSAASQQPPTSTRHEKLLPIASRTLPDAPEPYVIRQVGSDGEVHAWSPGDDALHLVERFPGAVEGDHATKFAFLSPDGQWLLVLTVAGKSLESDDTARLVDADGRVAWESGGVTGFGGIAWSPDSRGLVLSAGPETWWLLRITGGDVTAREIAVSAAPRPDASPSAIASPSGLVGSRLRPIGFSVDGSAVYGALTSAIDGTVQPAIRVPVAGGPVEPISAYPVRGSARLAPSTAVNQVVDPTTGRTATWGLNASIPGGPPAIEVRAADATIAYRLQIGVALGLEWSDDGRLIVLDADGFPFPNRMSLVPVAHDGKVGAPLVTTGPVDSGGILGLQGDYAVLVFRTVRPSDQTQVVVVGLADGASSALVLSPEETVDIVGGGLLP